MRALTDGDIIIGVCGDDVDPEMHPAVPADIPIDRLRVVDGAITDVAAMTDFYIDLFGRKHIVASDDWQPLTCAWDAVLIRDGDAWRVRTDADVLTMLKAKLRARIDFDAEVARLRYITGGAGQAISYSEKGAEAARFADDLNPDPADYPLLAASLGIEGETLQEVAALVTATRSAWLAAAAAIERLRLGAKAAISAAETEADAITAAAVEWPSATA